jgi:hypothetical protein
VVTVVVLVMVVVVVIVIVVVIGRSNTKGSRSSSSVSIHTSSSSSSNSGAPPGRLARGSPRLAKSSTRVGVRARARREGARDSQGIYGRAPYIEAL